MLKFSALEEEFKLCFVRFTYIIKESK